MPMKILARNKENVFLQYRSMMLMPFCIYIFFNSELAKVNGSLNTNYEDYQRAGAPCV